MMKKRLLTLVLAVAFVVGGALAAHGAEESVRIRNVDVAEFPEVSLTVSIEDRDAVDAADISIREGATTISAIEVQPLIGSGQIIEVVLVIDTSAGMEGSPMTAAIDGASAFIEALPDEFRVGVVAFSDSPQTLVRPTTDHAAAVEAVRGLVAQGSSTMNDAIIEAESLFSGEAQRNILLLSDGGDSASAAGLEQAIARATGAEVAVFAVGLRTPETDYGPLRRLARETGGRWLPSGADGTWRLRAENVDLRGASEALARELGGQFLVTYRSEAEANSQISLTAATPSGSDTVLTLTPAVKIDDAAAPKVSEPATPLLRDTWGLAVVLALIFGAVFVIGMMLIGTGARAARDRRLASLMSARAPSRETEAESDNERKGVAGLIPESLFEAAEKVSAAGGFADRFDRMLERAGMPVRPGEFAAMTIGAALAGLLIGFMLLGNLVFAIILAGSAWTMPHLWLAVRARRRMNKIQGQLPDVLMILASSLRAGHSFLQALDMVAQEIGAPSKDEFKRVVAEIRLGRPIDETLNEMAARIGSQDFDWAILAVNIQREVGGNLAESLDTVAETLRERETVRRQVDVLSAEGKLSVYILMGLPIAIAIYMAVVNPEYIGLLFSTRVGLVMVAVAASLMALGFAWMKRLVKIDV